MGRREAAFFFDFELPSLTPRDRAISQTLILARLLEIPDILDLDRLPRETPTPSLKARPSPGFVRQSMVTLRRGEVGQDDSV